MPAEKRGWRMKADTMYFGEIKYTKKELITFKEGLFGFESQKDFLPIPFEAEDDAVLCLQSVAQRDVSFIVMNPFRLDPEYSPALRPEDYTRLGTKDEEKLSYYVICVIWDTPEESTVNLKCPVVVNSDTRQAVQVILEDDRYRFRHSLSEFAGKES